MLTDIDNNNIIFNFNPYLSINSRETASHLTFKHVAIASILTILNGKEGLSSLPFVFPNQLEHSMLSHSFSISKENQNLIFHLTIILFFFPYSYLIKAHFLFILD